MMLWALIMPKWMLMLMETLSWLVHVSVKESKAQLGRARS